MKIGDKVKVCREYSHYDGAVGIIFGKDGDNFRVIDEDMTMGQYSSFAEKNLELLEEANYIPVPKHHKGDIVFGMYDGKYVELIIVQDRNKEMKYKCYIGGWDYTFGKNPFLQYTDDELLLENTSEEKEKPE